MDHEPNQASTWLKHCKKGKREVGIFELADLLDMTAEALRKYEAKQIIRPIRDEHQYRKFYSWDLTKIIKARKMRQEGFTLADIEHGMKSARVEDHVDMLETMQQSIAREILYKKQLMAWLAEQRNDIISLDHLGDRCIIEQLPALHCCVYMA